MNENKRKTVIASARQNSQRVRRALWRKAKQSRIHRLLRRPSGAPRHDEAISTWPIRGFFIAIVLLFWTNTWGFAESQKIRVGHFPNVTHAPALIARATRHFEKVFESETQIQWKMFNAGSLAIEALFAGEIDLLYTGPNPAINGFVRSDGQALRIIAGTASGGSAFVVRKDSEINRFEEIKGKRVATPQIGNSQDVALRSLMTKYNLVPRTKGGDVDIFNIVSGDQLTVLSRGEVDGIWTVEPWVSRLVSEANGKILFDEKELWPDDQYATVLLVVRKRFLEKQPELVQKWLDTHIKIIEWINQNTEEAKLIFNEELKRETGKPLPRIYLDQCFKRIRFTEDPMTASVFKSAERAAAIGFLGRKEIDLKNLYDLSFLNQAKSKSQDLQESHATFN